MDPTNKLIQQEVSLLCPLQEEEQQKVLKTK
jgi:hypothetical protein